MRFFLVIFSIFLFTASADGQPHRYEEILQIYGIDLLCSVLAQRNYDSKLIRWRKFNVLCHTFVRQVIITEFRNSTVQFLSLHSSDKDWRITPSLLNWRETVDSCTSAAQLAMCISMMKDCIAWERSIMKVVCLLLIHELLFLYFCFT